MEIKQQSFAFLYVLQTIIQTIKREHASKNVHQIMELMEHLVTTPQEFVNKFVRNQMHMQILKLSIDTVYYNVLKVRVNHLLIHQQKHVSVSVLYFQDFLLRLQLLLVLINAYRLISEIRTLNDAN